MPKSFFDQLGTLPQIGAVIHLGAGGGLEMPGLLALSARRLILVEPNAEVLPALRKSASDKRCEILALAIAENVGQAQLHRFNFPALCSLKAPLRALTDLLPGLTATGTAMVETLSLEALLARVELDRSEENVLIIDAPGMESQIVDMALAPDPTARFAHIILRAAADAMYEGAKGFAALSDTLQAAGYRCVSQQSSDPDFPEGMFFLDPLMLKAQRLEAELEECHAARAQSEHRAAARKRKAEELEQRLNASTAENETLNANAGALKKQVEELEQRLKTSAAEKETLRASSEAGKSKAEELEQRLKALTAEKEALGKTVRTCKEKLAAQETELNTMRSESTILQERLNRESANREKTEREFLRADAQLQLLKEFVEMNPQREAPAPKSASPAPRTRPPVSKKKPENRGL